MVSNTGLVEDSKQWFEDVYSIDSEVSTGNHSVFSFIIFKGSFMPVYRIFHTKTGLMRACKFYKNTQTLDAEVLYEDKEKLSKFVNLISKSPFTNPYVETSKFASILIMLHYGFLW